MGNQMKSAVIPRPPLGDAERRRFDAATKSRLDLFSSVFSNKIRLLDPATATTSEVASKVNELISLLQLR